MLQQVSVKTISLTLVLALGFFLLPAAQVQAQPGKKQQQRTDQSGKQQARTLTASQAAARASAQYGGKVLKVSPSGNGYRVKMLTEAGRVRTVTIRD
jgi:starvation-inducible outer membrane lipoprotein